MSKVNAKPRTNPRKVGRESFFSGFELEKILPEKYHVPAVITLLLTLFMIFLQPLFFGGKSFQSGDIIASQSAVPYLEKAREGFTLWNPHIFCGMPAYSIAVGFTWFNLIYVIITEVRNLFMLFFSVDYAKWAFYLIILSITSFFLMKHLVKNTLISLFGAIATAFSTGIIVFLYIGHVTKLTSLCMFPLIFLMLLRMQKKMSMLDFFILVIAMQLLVQGFHVQIIFYLGLMTAVYFLYFIILSLVKKQNELRNNILKSLAAIAVAVVIALAIQSDNLSQVYEYTPYSTRGTKSIGELNAGPSEKSESAYYDYHTGWSFSPGEVLTFIIPSYYGFGYSTYKGPLSQEQEVEVNTYFGQMPFVDVAMYMGVIVFLLALFAMLTRYKEPLVQFLSIVTVLALLLSFGKNFSLVFDLFFYHLPSFDKFRVPSMILVLVQFCVPLLAALGLHKILNMRNEADRFAESVLKYGAALLSVLFIGALAMNQSLAASFTERAAASSQGEQLKPIFSYMSDMFTADILFAFIASSAVFWLGYLAARKSLSGDVFVAVVIVLTVFDLWRVDSRGARYTEAPGKDALFTEPEYVRVIKAQHDKEPFRILNLKQDNSLGSVQQNSNFNAYFLLEDFYGYSAIKPRAFQDMMDIVGPANPVMWRMANVKYIILDREYSNPGFQLISGGNKTYVYKNLSALGRYYFTDSVAQKASMDVLKNIKEEKFDPAKVAYTEVTAPKVDRADSTASIQVQKYTDEVSSLKVSAPGNNFLVFASTYHPKGWKAYVDGNETTLYRANHAYMGIVVPKGNHEVEFRYAPKSFYIAKYTSLILSSLSLLGLFAGIYTERKKRGVAAAN